MDIEKRVADLEKRVAALEKQLAKKEKKPRAPSEYNNYVGKRLKELKEAQPNLPQAELMKLVAKEWKSKA